MISNKYFSISRTIKYLTFFTIFILVITSTVSSFGCGKEKQSYVIDLNKVVDFGPFDEKIDMKQQIFEPIEITILHTNDTRGNIQPCG